MNKPRPTRQRPVSPPGAGDTAPDDLVGEVRELVNRERLHVPAALEGDPVELPFDLTTVSDKELQRLYSAFSSYSYRTGYLLSLEEVKSSKCGEAAETLIDAYIATHGEGKESLTVLKAQAAQLDDVQSWLRRKKMHSILADSLRRQRDNYDKVVERISRHESMREGEWLRAGNGPQSKKPSRPSFAR